MNATECFENYLSCILNELFRVISEEKIVLKNRGTFFKHFLSFSEVEFDVQTKKLNFKINSKDLGVLPENEFGYWILIGIFFLFNNFH